MNKKRIFDIVGNSIMWIFISFSIVASVFMISSNSSDDGYPTVFGKTFVSVENDIENLNIFASDLLIIEERQENSVLEIKEGDQIIYRQTAGATSEAEEMVMGDTVVSVELGSDGNFILNLAQNPALTVAVEAKRLGGAQFIGFYDNLRVPLLGAFFGFFVSSAGFIAIVIIPLVLLFLFELFNYIIVVLSSRSEKGISKEEREKIAAAAVEEYKASIENDKKL